MKFGKVLQQSMQVSSRDWENHWVDYKLLKRIIKDCAQIKTEEKLEGSTLSKLKIKPNAKEDNDSIRQSPDEMNFFRTLRSEIKKIADFFIREQGAFIGRVKVIEDQFVDLQLRPKPETKTELMRGCVSLYKELLLLENYAVMNFCGISKILKKHDKWTGYATRNKFMRTILMKQPFATYLPLLQMIDRLEHIFMEATGGSIDQHDTRKGSSHSGRRHGGERTTTGPDGGDGTSPMSSGVSTNGSPSASIPSNSPPRRTMNGSPPPPDEAVSLNRVHALRDDARLFRETESVDVSYDGDDDGDGESVDGTEEGMKTPERSEQPPIERVAPPQMAAPQTSVVGMKEYASDSDAAAIAMLAMKQSSLRMSDSETGATRFKRKACSPLTEGMGSNGKRKMSFATILN